MSFPPGLDVREYGYGVASYTVPDGNSYTLSTRGEWLVSKVQAYNGANAADVGLVHGGDLIHLLAGGCLCIEPSGAFRGEVLVQGEGLLVIVEFFFQANAERGGDPPTVVIT